MASLDVMFKTGLYITDLSMHDSSRDLVLAGTQQSVELKLALDQVKKLEFVLCKSRITAFKILCSRFYSTVKLFEFVREKSTMSLAYPGDPRTSVASCSHKYRS